MKKVLMQFAGNLLSKEQMKVVKGGDSYDGGSSGTGSGADKTCYTITWDVAGGCGNYSSSGYYSGSSTAVKAADAVISYYSAFYPGTVTGYNIKPCMA